MLQEGLIVVGSIALGFTAALIAKKYTERKKRAKETRELIHDVLDNLAKREKERTKALDELQEKFKNLKTPEDLMKEMLSKGIIKAKVEANCYLKDGAGYISLKDSNELKFTKDAHCYEINDIQSKIDKITRNPIIDILWNANDTKGMATAIEILEDGTRLILRETREVNID